MMLRCFSIKITNYWFNLFVSMGFERGLFKSDKHTPIFSFSCGSASCYLRVHESCTNFSPVNINSIAYAVDKKIIPYTRSINYGLFISKFFISTLTEIYLNTLTDSQFGFQEGLTTEVVF